MFRKASEVGSPKIQSKYILKYGFNQEPKFLETYKRFLTETRVVTPDVKDASRKIIIIQVKNVALRAREEDLYKLFSTYGRITAHRIYMSEGGKHKHGFICYKHNVEAEKAIKKLHGMTFKGKTLVVSMALTREDRKECIEYLCTLKHNVDAKATEPRTLVREIQVPDQ